MDILSTVVLAIGVIGGIVFFVALFEIILNKNAGLERSSKMNVGLVSLLDKHGESVDIGTLSNEIEEYYNLYIEKHPASRNVYRNVAEWLREVLMEINLDKRNHQDTGGVGSHYEKIREAKNCFDAKYPFACFPAAQEKILADAKAIEGTEDVVKRMQDEFLRCNVDINSKRKTNRRAIMIGVLGILALIASVLFQVL